MCLILCAYRAHPRFDLVIAANRDEFLGRPTAAASWWKDAPDLLAGRDLEQMGTWLGCTRSGRIAAVTNVRERRSERPAAPSRGDLVRDFLESSAGLEEYLDRLRGSGVDYNGYNLLFGSFAGFPTAESPEPSTPDGPSVHTGSAGGLAYHSNRGGAGRFLAPGVYGISNHLLDTPWPKVRRGKRLFTQLLGRQDGTLPFEELFTLLSDRTVAPDEELPDTGLGVELERLVSPIFTVGEEYGTRCSTVITIDRKGRVDFEERDAQSGSVERHSFTISAKPG